MEVQGLLERKCCTVVLDNTMGFVTLFDTGYSGVNSNTSLPPPPQSFTDLQHRPQLVDLTVEEGQRLKVIYGSSLGFHVIDVDSGNPYDIYVPSHVSLCVV